MSPSQRYSFDDNDEYEAAGNGVRDGQRTPRDDDEDDDEDEYGEQSSPSKRPQSQGGSNKKNSTATPQMGSEATIRSLSLAVVEEELAVVLEQSRSKEDKTSWLEQKNKELEEALVADPADLPCTEAGWAVPGKDEQEQREQQGEAGQAEGG
eukprot:999171-Rhodomonas_salina.1